MKAYLDCFPCCIRQALGAARRAEASQEQSYEVLQQSLKALQKMDIDITPPEIGLVTHRIARQITGISDPYLEDKAINTRQALELYPRMKSQVENSPDPLDTAIRLSIAGNIIDLGFAENVGDIWQNVERILQQPYGIDDTALFREKMSSASFILFLADNAGETVFDRVLIETLPVPVFYGVKGQPILNDATREDAIAAGLDGCSTIISNGTAAPGTVLSICSEEFLEIFESASLIVSKGQGNYESLSNAGEKIFCFLQAKCTVISQDLGAPLNSAIVRQSTNNQDS